MKIKGLGQLKKQLKMLPSFLSVLPKETITASQRCVEEELKKPIPENLKALGNLVEMIFSYVDFMVGELQSLNADTKKLEDEFRVHYLVALTDLQQEFSQFKFSLEKGDLDNDQTFQNYLRDFQKRMQAIYGQLNGAMDHMKKRIQNNTVRARFWTISLGFLALACLVGALAISVLILLHLLPGVNFALAIVEFILASGLLICLFLLGAGAVAGALISVVNWIRNKALESKAEKVLAPGAAVSPARLDPFLSIEDKNLRIAELNRVIRELEAKINSENALRDAKPL